MKVTVWSHFRDETWEGDMPELQPLGSEQETNEHLFRYFNRVDELDGRRLERIGYRLPSLSVGDRVTWKGRTWEVAGIGFQEVTA
jgi:hypothetical protein